jgi:hypothetical protein
MRNHIDIDHVHSRAIAQEIGERLRASLRVDSELPTGLRIQMDQLRKLEAPPIVPQRTTHWWTRQPRTR